MTTVPISFIDDGDGVSVIGERIAVWVRREGQAKQVARVFGVAIATATQWRIGHNPQFRHLLKMIDRWGEAFLLDVFEPVLTESDVSLDRRLDRLGQEFSAFRIASNAAWAKVEFVNEKGEKIDRPADGAVARQSGGTARVVGKVVEGSRRGINALLLVAIWSLSAGAITDDWRLPQRNNARVASYRLSRGRGHDQ